MLSEMIPNNHKSRTDVYGKTIVTFEIGNRAPSWLQQECLMRRTHPCLSVFSNQTNRESLFISATIERR
jgi:hypothetical protein